MATCRNFDAGSDQITQLCNFCETNISDGYCNDCAAYMCQICFDRHTRGKTCRNHVLLDDSCARNGNNKTNSEPCKRHPNQIIKFYCVSHEIVGCVECFFPEHRNCQYQNIVDAAKKFQESGEDTRLKRELRRLENVHSECTKQCQQDQETADVINNTTVEDVKSFKDTVTSYVAKVEELALEKSEKLRLENETRLEKRSSELDNIGEDIELCMVKLENQNSVDKLFIAAVEIKPKLEIIGQNIISLGCQSVVKKYGFQPNKLIIEMIQESRSFGDVCVLAEEPSNAEVFEASGDLHQISPIPTDMTKSMPGSTTVVHVPVTKEAKKRNEPEKTQRDTNIGPELFPEDREVFKASSHLQPTPPPTQAMSELIDTVPVTKPTIFDLEANIPTEKEYGIIPANIASHSSLAEKKTSFQFRHAKTGQSVFIKSDACPKPFRYTPAYGAVSIDGDLLHDGDHCYSMGIEDGIIRLDEIVHPEIKKSNFKLKPVRGGLFYLIKSDDCQKPFKYTPKYGEICIDEEVNCLYDGDVCFSIIIKDGRIVLDELKNAQTEAR